MGWDRNPDIVGLMKRVSLFNVHWSVTQEEVKALCMEYGMCDQVMVYLTEEYGYPTGHFDVEMSNEKEAARVFREMHGVEVKGLRIVTGFASSMGHVGELIETEKGTKGKQFLYRKPWVNSAVAAKYGIGRMPLKMRSKAMNFRKELGKRLIKRTKEWYKKGKKQSSHPKKYTLTGRKKDSWVVEYLQRMRAKDRCMNCGQLGHWAVDCSQPAKTARAAFFTNIMRKKMGMRQVGGGFKNKKYEGRAHFRKRRWLPPPPKTHLKRRTT